jgi:hypothetical protein
MIYEPPCIKIASRIGGRDVSDHATAWSEPFPQGALFFWFIFFSGERKKMNKQHQTSVLYGFTVDPFSKGFFSFVLMQRTKCRLSASRFTHQ